MKHELVDLGPTRKQLQFEVPSDVVDQEIARVAKDYGKSARVPGFRPGKAPEKVVRQRYKEQILHDVMHDLVPRVLDEALREHALEPIETPDVRDLVLKEGAPLTFLAEFETLPPVEPLDYSTITLRRSPVQIADEAVDVTLQRLRERNARFEPVEDREVGDRDVLNVDVIRHVQGKPGQPGGAPIEPETHADVSVEIGNPVNPPGFDAEIVGMRPGESRTFSITFPDAYGVEELAGALVEYTVTVKAIKRKVLPALDDEFAKDLGEFASLEELRARVRDDLGREAERTQEREIRSDLLRQLASRVPGDVPEPLVAREVERRMQDFIGRLIEAGVDPEKVQVDWQEYHTSQREPAIEAVKSMLVLDDVARREHITVAEDALEGELARLAERTGRSVNAVREKLAREGGLARLIAGMRRDRTVEFLLARVTIVTV